MADEDDRSGGTRSAGGVELLVESVVRGWSTTSSGVFGGVCGRVVVGGGPRRCVGAVGGPVGFRFWRFGRIVPPRAPSRCRHNRAIARESPGASGVPVRTILPGRRFPFWAGPAAAVRERRRSGGRRLVRDFRVRSGSCASGSWRHCAVSGRTGRTGWTGRVRRRSRAQRRPRARPRRRNPRRNRRRTRVLDRPRVPRIRAAGEP